eukprot:CAMPEP_0174982744 /NCGR_PEP_ID=MMETSP0004_2-20121128/16706_1 /TAXON_ID=420556 /ORGANISM="Ochromonas sp., Strain CCMP1393" /LENGTH=176 /DNA_ID=CAMNT_0016234815 /DNA_START=82 /DNA_END=610 /DNA_ORIENTATION=-
MSDIAVALENTPSILDMVDDDAGSGNAGTRDECVFAASFRATTCCSWNTSAATGAGGAVCKDDGYMRRLKSSSASREACFWICSRAAASCAEDMGSLSLLEISFCWQEAKSDTCCASTTAAAAAPAAPEAGVPWILLALQVRAHHVLRLRRGASAGGAAAARVEELLVPRPQGDIR